MGHTNRRPRPAPQARTSRATRSKGRPLADPGENTQHLTEQLRALGLYAAATLGDGNCLFRALSDQLYGTDYYHASLRQAICNWIETHKSRYAPFVDDERGLDVHLECMRQQATYGGHLELSAFAHMTRRNVKVIQPGLVYVIEWDAGGDPSLDPPSDALQRSTSRLPPVDGDATSNNREKRRSKREKPPPDLPTEDSTPSASPVYVAYHDWEHFSSIRNLRGPHAGLPNVQETLTPDEDVTPASPTRQPPSKGKPKPTKWAFKPSQAKRAKNFLAATTSVEPTPSLLLTPSQVPLPASRSPSPDVFSQPSLSSRSSILSSTPSHMIRAYRSPKRTFDESSASSEESQQGAAKRAKPASQLSQTDSLPVIAPTSTPETDITIDIDDGDFDTPSLSAASPASSSSLSSVPSPAASPPPESQPTQKPLTRRQRKQMGLPKPRLAMVGSARASAGKIIIPGGKFRPKAKGQGEEEEEEEWMKNGTGRVDVRGFRELKI